jgi:hypothetical protein
MKKRIVTKLALILLVPLVYFLLAFGVNDINKPEKPMHLVPAKLVPIEPKYFINGVYNMDLRYCSNYPNGWIPNGLWVGDYDNLQRYLELNYNTTHVYPVDNSSYGTFADAYESPQITNNLNLIQAVHDAPLKFFPESVKFSYLMYAQRVVYEVPYTNGNYDANVKDGFCYQNVSGELMTDDGRTVLYNQKQDEPQYTLICSGIYENLEHSDFLGRQFDQNDWYIKPMVKADLTNIPDGTPIFRVVYFNFNGDSISNISITILARNFVQSNVYDYKFFNYSNPINLIVSGRKDTGLNVGRENADLKNCKVDFKIYWYGTVDFWFDKLTVDDFYADKLFDINDNYDDKIADELTNIAQNAGSNFYAYHMDEMAYSQLPCVKYLIDKIDAFNIANNTNIRYEVSQSNWYNVKLMRNTSIGFRTMLSTLHPQRFIAFDYDILGWYGENEQKAYIPAYAFPSEALLFYCIYKFKFPLDI